MNKAAYRSLFLHFSGKIEKLLIRLAVTAFILMVLAQLLLQVDAVRFWISETDRLEGWESFNPYS